MKIGSRFVKKIDTKLYWKTKNGEIVKISRMDDEYLINTINFIKERAKKIAIKIRIYEIKRLVDEVDVTDSIHDVIDETIDHLVGTDDLKIVEEYFKPYKNMLHEAYLRGLEEEYNQDEEDDVFLEVNKHISNNEVLKDIYK